MADTKQYMCAQCGTGFEAERKRKYCGKRCLWVAAGRRKGKRPLSVMRDEQRARTHRECPECKSVFRTTRHDGHSKGPQVYCSLSCRHAETNRQRKVEADAAMYRRWALATKRRRLMVEMVRACADCGANVARYARRCEECWDVRDRQVRARNRKTPAGRAAKAKGKAIRRLRSDTVGAERFDPLEIFERDGWRCHLCHCKTPKKLRGTVNERAPELDHIIPLAAGGEHSRRNTACACRKCNGLKGAEPRGQLRLIG